MPRLPKAKKKSWLATSKKKTGYQKKHTSINRDFYTSKAWAELRALYIKSFPLCKWCEEEGRVVEADVVDHVKEIIDGGEPLDTANLQSLCHKHHTQKTNWERAKRKKQWK